jgi:serine/threonine protein kinase
MPTQLSMSTQRLDQPGRSDRLDRQYQPRGCSGDLVEGRYRLRSLAGVGGMGAVWKAHDQDLDRLVALKEGDAAGALNEAQLAARIDHPNVLHVHDVVVAGRESWIVMDLVEGRSLSSELRRRGRLAADRVLDLASQLLDALSAVHAAEVVHRDVKPGNVLITGTGRVVLVDFGLAMAPSQPTSAADRRLLGSPPYVAPETLRNGEIDAAGDLFAFGATLFAAIEGRRPFDAGTPAATLRALLRGPLPAFRYAGGLTPLLLGLLDRDPAGRLTADQAREQLEQLTTHPQAA